MKRIYLLLLIVIIFVGCGKKEEQQYSGRQEGNRNYIDQGVQYLQDGNVGDAIKSFDMAIQQDPSNPSNYLVLGQVYLKLGNAPKAVDTFSAATKVDPSSGEAFYLLATSQALTGNMDQAVESAKTSVDNFAAAKNEESFKRSLVLLKSLTEARDQKSQERQADQTIQ